MLARAGIVVSGAIESEKWADLAEEAGELRFESAVGVAVEQGKRSLAYVRGVVRHSMAEKRMPGDAPPRASPRASPDKASPSDAPIYNSATEQYERLNPKTCAWEAVEKDDQGGWRVIPWLSGGDDDGTSD